MRQPDNIAIQVALIQRDLIQLANGVAALMEMLNIAPAKTGKPDTRAESMRKRWEEARKKGLTKLPHVKKQSKRPATKKAEK